MIKPYYQDSHCIIYHGNCLDILPHLEPVDLVLTDPPYGIGEHGGKCRTRGNPGYSKHKNMGWDKHRPPQTAFDLMLTAGEVSVIWGGNYFADMLPATMGWLYWRKLMGGDFSDGELAWTSRNRALKEFTICPKGMDKKHPCQKPIKLLTWCVSTCCPDANTILDPFMGSGTTLVAAKELGRKAIGIEISKEYCDIAVKRLRQEVLF
jgi:DNA modification methylase